MSKQILRIAAINVLLLLFHVVATATTKTSSQNADQKNDMSSSSPKLTPDYLTRESVVLITGAAGFIGSELAMALYRTYRPKKIICIDSMDSGFGGLSPELITAQTMSHRTERDLALLEFKRQRVFRLLQTLGTTAHFYRVDLRPNIPEFFEAGEVPILHHIFSMHKDITHVVHLADPYHRGTLQEKTQSLMQAVPRLKDQPKAGMIEAILEQLRLLKIATKTSPHFVYASSFEVYNFRQGAESNSNPPPFAEEKPLTTPSTLAGASKLMDEVLVQAYHETDEIYSVGLRFFSVYGPWGLPGSPLFEMAERAVLGQSLFDLKTDIMDDIRDYIYIDDAIDAIMTAMQFRTHQSVPVVFNVGSGKGTTLRSLAHSMQVAMGNATKQDVLKASPPETIAIASMKRSKALLGLQTRVPIEKGIDKLLAWHYDRAFPYGRGPDHAKNRIADNGMVSCPRYDSECLNGAPVFPCASECSNPNQCISSLYDDVFVITRRLTEECTDVLYTVALDENLVALPSAKIAVSDMSKSRIENVGVSKCNIAFVSDASPLVRQLMRSFSTDSLAHGFWTLVPVTLSKYTAEHIPYIALVPKLSPGLFFGSKVKRSIYTDPNIMFDSIPNLLAEFEKTPHSASLSPGNTLAKTAVMIGKRSAADEPHFSSASDRHPTKQAIVQESAYRMIRIAAINEMLSEAFTQHVDSSFIVHALTDDARLFRCDVMAELVQWDVSKDASALEFIMGLHDMWSRVIARKQGEHPWWVMGNLEEKVIEKHYQSAGKKETKDSKKDKSTLTKSKKKNVEDKLAVEKKLKTEEAADQKESQSSKDADVGTVGTVATAVKTLNKNKIKKKKTIDDVDAGTKSTAGSAEEEIKKLDGVAGQKHEDSEAVHSSNSDNKGNKADMNGKFQLSQTKAERRRRLDTEDDDEEEDEEDTEDGPMISGWGEEHSSYGMPESIQDAVRAVFGDVKSNAQQNKDDDDFVGNNDGNAELGEDEKVDHKDTENEQEVVMSGLTNDITRNTDSSDIWLGILSSTQVQYFARIVPSATIGVIHLDGYPK